MKNPWVPSVCVFGRGWYLVPLVTLPRWEMMLALIGVFIVLSAAVSAHRNPLLPKEWTSFSVVGGGIAVTSYLTAATHVGDTTCSNDDTMVSGIGFGACMVGGSPLKGLMYTFTRQGLGTLHYNVSNFHGPDCTGEADTYPTLVKTDCSYEGVDGWQYGFTNSTEGWKGTPKGIVVQNWYDNACHDAADVWDSISSSHCLPCSDSGAQSMRFSKCTQTAYTLDKFSDAACQTLISTADYPTQSCYRGEYISMERMLCNA